MTSRKNRPERSRFRCISCGLEEEADLVASINIRNRAAVNQPIVAGLFLIIRSTQLQANVLQPLVVDADILSYLKVWRFLIHRVATRRSPFESSAAVALSTGVNSGEH